MSAAKRSAVRARDLDGPAQLVGRERNGLGRLLRGASQRSTAKLRVVEKDKPHVIDLADPLSASWPGLGS